MLAGLGRPQSKFAMHRIGYSDVDDVDRLVASDLFERFVTVNVPFGETDFRGISLSLVQIARYESSDCAPRARLDPLATRIEDLLALGSKAHDRDT